MEQQESDKELHLWGREIDLDDYIEGHYGDSRTEPTPEGGQAGIAQGTTAAQGRTADLTGDASTGDASGESDTYAATDQFTTSGEVSKTELAREKLHEQT